MRSSITPADCSIFVEGQQRTSYDDQLAVALRAEALGFGAFFRSDHYLNRCEGSTSSLLAGLTAQERHSRDRHAPGVTSPWTPNP